MTKIKPQLYRKILEDIDLQNIYLKNFEGRINLDIHPKSASVNISSEADFTTKAENRVEISHKWDIIAKDKNTDSEFLKISVTYGLILESKERFTKDFFDIYEKTSLPINVWPFVREFVNSMTARMNVPPLTLPLLKFTKKKRSRSGS